MHASARFFRPIQSIPPLGMHIFDGRAARPALRALSSASSSQASGSGSGSGSGSSAHAHHHVPVIRTLPQLRRWRKAARDRRLEVGVVPTMGALHQGHLDLVKASLKRHPLTVMTLFVNPMQFAPHEDLSSYPRTMERDLELLRGLLNPAAPVQTSGQPVLPSSSSTAASHASMRGLGISEFESFRTPPSAPDPLVRGLGVSEFDSVRAGSARAPGPAVGGGDSPLVVFAPSPDVMYPLKGEIQDMGKHKGVSVDMKGWGDVMEGASRPQFFKGVATVCTKLFNAVEPDHAYFGQKDIQQALLLKIMLTDLLMAHPTPDNLHILPTTRDPNTNLALSSRNAYLSPAEMRVAPTLYRALAAARDLYPTAGGEAGTPASGAGVTGEELISRATHVVSEEITRIATQGKPVEMRLDYFEVFDRWTFEPVRGRIEPGRECVIAGAVWVGKTRLIDNLLLGWEVA